MIKWHLKSNSQLITVIGDKGASDVLPWICMAQVDNAQRTTTALLAVTPLLLYSTVIVVSDIMSELASKRINWLWMNEWMGMIYGTRKWNPRIFPLNPMLRNVCIQISFQLNKNDLSCTESRAGRNKPNIGRHMCTGE